MSFDTLAPVYHWMERIFAGGKMQQCRIAFLDQIPEPKNILLPGEGPGRFLVPCRLKFPRADITCVDASAGMTAQARRSLARAGLPEDRVEFVQADILGWSPPPVKFDLVATHFFLDCFREDQLAALIPNLARATTADAIWLVSDFQNAHGGLRHLRTRAIISVLYAFFRITTRLPAKTLVPPAPFLEDAGFSLHQRIEGDWGLLKSDWWRKETTNHKIQNTR